MAPIIRRDSTDTTVGIVVVVIAIGIVLLLGFACYKATPRQENLEVIRGRPKRSVKRKSTKSTANQGDHVEKLATPKNSIIVCPICNALFEPIEFQTEGSCKRCARRDSPPVHQRTEKRGISPSPSARPFPVPGNPAPVRTRPQAVFMRDSDGRPYAVYPPIFDPRHDQFLSPGKM